MFRTVPLSIKRCISLYTQQWYICHTACEQDQDPVYSEIHLLIDRGTVRNM